MGMIHKFFFNGNMCLEHFRKNQIENSEFSKFVNAFIRSNFGFEFEILLSESKTPLQQLSGRKILGG